MIYTTVVIKCVHIVKATTKATGTKYTIIPKYIVATIAVKSLNHARHAGYLQQKD